MPPQVANPYDHLGDQAEFGPALFSKLVPFAVHVAVSIYEERRDRLVNNNIISELETLTEKLHTILSSLNLPGSLQALEKPLGLPGALVQHAEEIRQADAINRLHRGFADIEKLRSSDRAVFEEGRRCSRPRRKRISGCNASTGRSAGGDRSHGRILLPTAAPGSGAKLPRSTGTSRRVRPATGSCGTSGNR